MQPRTGRCSEPGASAPQRCRRERISPTANRVKCIELLNDTPVRLAHLSVALSEEQLRQLLATGERSCTEILAHILNCEARLSEAMYLALLLNKPLISAIHPERQWGSLLHYEQFPFRELLSYFKLRRTMLLRVLSELSDPQWERVVRELGKQRQESVFWQVRGLALHELEHLTDLEAKL
jgi:DinB superfamily